MGASHNWPFIINLGNSIIGVALLAMPFCFQKCGILLSILVLVFCTWLTLISCQLLMKAGITSRRRSYEFLAYYTHGATGKFVSEVGMIGFQLGTLIAQIVVIGDLGPSIVTKIFGIENSHGLRTALMILLCITIGLPMALIKDIRAVSRISTVCVAFYSSFVLYVFWLSIPNLWTGSWYQKVYFWRPQGLFQSLPILSFSFGCQTQLFLLYDALPEPSLKAMSKVVNCAVNMCAVGYLMVGFCGYIAFYTHDIPGDVISIFPNIFFTDLMKVCFVVSIVITFPVIVFPCRASIYTLLYAKKSKARDDVIDLETHIPSKQLKVITVSLVVGSMIIGILIPNVEFILGMNGAIMGTLICYIFPALFYLKVMGSKPEGRSLAQFVLFLGITILLVSTYATLREQEKGKIHVEELLAAAKKPMNTGIESMLPQKPFDTAENKQTVLESKDSVVKKSDILDGEYDDEIIDDIRQEPPNPDPPDAKAKLLENLKLGERRDIKQELIDEGAKNAGNNKMAASNKAMEIELQEKGKKQDEILAELEKQRIEQKMLIEEQKQLLKEFKDHHEKDMKQGIQQQLPLQNQQNPIPQQQQQQQLPIQNQQDPVPQQQQQVAAQPQQQLPIHNQQDPVPQQQQQQRAAQPQQELPIQNQQDPILQQQQQQQGAAQPQQQLSIQKQDPIFQQQQQYSDAQLHFSKQPQIGPEQQENVQDRPNQLKLQQINGTAHLDNSKQEQVAKNGNILNKSIVIQRQNDGFDIDQQQQQQKQIQNNQMSDSVQDQNQQLMFAQEQDQNKQQHELLPQEQEQKVETRELNKDQQVLQSETKMVQRNENNVVPENLQQKSQDVDILKRDKRDVDGQNSNVVDTKVILNKMNEDDSSDKDSPSQLVYNNKSEVNTKQNKLVAEEDAQSKITEIGHEKSINVALQEDGTNDTQKPKTNEEMRRKLKSFDLFQKAVEQKEELAKDKIGR